jgi:4-amino-4-deoxy-L-arabinose transferase-like glycosyltransferase
MSTRPRRLARLAALGALLCIATPLVLYDLGGPWLFEDEADTVLFARAIVRTGVPSAWDGRSFTDSDDGRRIAPRALGRDLVMVGTPWLPYYVTAASFAVLGESAWTARLPFALAALATVAMLYALVMRTTGCAASAFAAALLLAASPQFLLYARQCRSYVPNMLLTLLVLWGFLRLGVHRRDPWLAIAAVLLFHVQVLPAAIALGACAAVALFDPAMRPRLVPLLSRAPWVMAFTLPWLALSWRASSTNWAAPEGPGELPLRLAQLASEGTIAVPLVGWAIGLPLVARRLRPGDRTLLRVCGAWMAVMALLVPGTLSASLLEVVSLRYVCGLLPIAAAVTGVLVARASGERRLLYAGLLALFAGTHLAGNALPWLAAGGSRRVGGVALHVPRELAGKLANLELWAFVRGLGVPDPGTLAPLTELLRARAVRDDVVLTNFGWDTLYYYTGLPLGMRIEPDAPARAAAPALGLPPYVFGPEGADWVVWRGGNEAWLGYPLTLQGLRLLELRRLLLTRGARLERVATLHETLWENRPELYWHRFPGVGYPFAPRAVGPSGPVFRDAQVFRVHWNAR